MQRTYEKTVTTKRRGIAMMAALIFMTVFIAMAVGMMTMSSHNAIAASNLQTSNVARATAESGLELVRYWMHQVTAYTTDDLAYGQMIQQLEDVLFDSEIPYAVNESGNAIYIGPVVLDADSGRSFEAIVRPEYDISGVQMAAVVKGTLQGQNSTLTRALLVGYRAEPDGSTSPYNWWDFGVASKGPLSLKSLEIDAIEDVNGLDVKVGADAYIESSLSNNALTIQNAQISGNVQIVNPDATVDWSGGQSSIGGEKDETLALANHVEVGVAPVEFPDPDPGHFEQYVTGTTLSTADATYNNVTLENVRIAANTNPKFTGNTVIKGVLYIEQPNTVEFGGNAEITGIIVGDGDVTDNSGTNTIDFKGTVSSSSVSALPESYGDIRNETGTFLMAPGFAVSFGGNFGTLNGCIVANGVRTYGNAGGTIAGSILNFSDQPMLLEGKDLLFRKSGIDNIPPHLRTANNRYWSFKYVSAAYKEGKDLWPE